MFVYLVKVCDPVLSRDGGDSNFGGVLSPYGPTPVMDSTLSGMDSPINMTDPTSVMDYINCQ